MCSQSKKYWGEKPWAPERLEKTLDAKYLVRTNGLYYLNLARDWRIGATAHRIISLAEANGSRVLSAIGPAKKCCPFAEIAVDPNGTVTVTDYS